MYGYQRVLTYMSPDGKDGNTAIDLAYAMFFAYNGTAESHAGDMEFVVVRLREDKPTGVYFSNHGGGYWVQWPGVKLSPEGQVLVHVAQESHALCHQSGTNPRILGFANDVHSPGAQLTPGVTYDLVDFTTKPKDKPWLWWTGGRDTQDHRPMLINDTLWYPDKRVPETDFPSFVSRNLSRGVKIGIVTALILLILVLVVMGMRFRRPWLSALAVLPAVALGMMWLVVTATAVVSVSTAA